MRRVAEHLMAAALEAQTDYCYRAEYGFSLTDRAAKEAALAVRKECVRALVAALPWIKSDILEDE